jgi:hypothetical protein
MEGKADQSLGRACVVPAPRTRKSCDISPPVKFVAMPYRKSEMAIVVKMEKTTKLYRNEGPLVRRDRV